VWLIIILFPVSAYSQSPGIHNIADTDLVLLVNPASLVTLDHPVMTIYGERKFMLNELNYYSLIAACPVSSGGFGVKAVYSGSLIYNESQLGISYGRKLAQRLAIGAQFNYYNKRIQNYGKMSAIGFEAGTVLYISDKLYFSLLAVNPVGGKFAKSSSEKLSTVYSFGLGYAVSEKFFAGIEIEKEEDQIVNINTGFSYKGIKRLVIRSGISCASSSIWIAFGITLRYFQIEISTLYHSAIGITPGLLLLFNFKRN